MLAFLCMLNSCGEKIEDFSGFLKFEIVNLLTSLDGEKNWIRIEKKINDQLNEDACLDSLTYKFTVVDNKTDTSGYLFIKPYIDKCDSLSFCNEFPERCEDSESFCAKNPTICENLEENYFFAGSWFIPEPDIENGKVNEIIISDYSGVTSYRIEFITSINLELVATENETSTFEKFLAE